MLKRLALSCCLLLALLLPQASRASEIQRHEFPAPALGRPLVANVYLPGGYAGSGQAYPVLYLLHGYGGDEKDWSERGALSRIVDGLIRQGAMPPALIVMPAAGMSWYVDSAQAGLGGDMETALIRDLLPAVAARFRLRQGRQARLIGGLSMGGFGALRLGLKYPDLFGAVALFSPAIYDPEPPANSAARRPGVFVAADGAFDARLWQRLNYPPLLENFLKTGHRLPVFISSGDDDEYGIEFHAAQLYRRLRQAGQPAELRIVNGAHAWGVWEAMLPEALAYIFRTDGK